MEKILITGATGHYGKTTIDFLLSKGVSPNSIYALVRSEEKGAELKVNGINIRIGEYDNYNSLVEAFHGIDKLLLVSGSDVVNRGIQHINAVNAAKEVGVKHILYTSFERKNETESSPIAFLAKSHIDTDNAIKASGMNYTIFRNNLYLDVLPMFLGEQVLTTGIYFPAGDAQAAFVSRNDLAEATANVLMNSGHENKEYTMNNIENYTFQYIAEVLSSISNRTVQYTSPDKQQFVDMLTNIGVPEHYIGMSAGFAEAIKQGEFEASTTDLEKLLGRKPISAKEFLSSIYSI